MVVFVDLESENDDDPYEDQTRSTCWRVQQYLHEHGHLNSSGIESAHSTPQEVVEQASARSLADDTNGRLLATTFTCYPVALSIASELDLNDLFALSSTCRMIQHAMGQFAHQLRAHSLRCSNDTGPLKPEYHLKEQLLRQSLSDAVYATPDAAAVDPAFPPSLLIETVSRNGIAQAPLDTSRKIQCARDLVAPCRRCGTVVCRNCALKPISDRYLPNRHRRLCETCLETPLVNHLHQLQDEREWHDSPPDSSANSTSSFRSASPASGTHSINGPMDTQRIVNPAFTSPAFWREPCVCSTRGLYLCRPCGYNLHSADTTYKRVWTWRSRYSTHIGGGLGTGLGLGDQGQKCGRENHCLEKGVAGVCWVEIECSEPRSYPQELGISRSSTPLADCDHEGTINKPGYLSQEIEGIGGVVRKKVKKKIKTGGTVYEFEDERESGKYLDREISGRQRSWCGWCFRVCPSKLEVLEICHVPGIQQ